MMISAGAMRTIILRLFAILLLLGLVACGGTSDDFSVSVPTTISVAGADRERSTSDTEITLGGSVNKSNLSADPGFVTWSNGGTTILGAAPVTVVCFIVCEGHWKATVQLGLGTNTIIFTYFGVSASVTVTRFLAFKVSGKVQTANQRPLMSPDVVVTRTDAAVSEVNARLDNSGNYEFPVVVPGTYTITPKLSPNVSPLCLTFSPPIRIVDVMAADVSGQDFVTTHPCYSISGWVTTPFGSIGYEGVEITIEDSNGNVLTETTNLFGRYEFRWLLQGTYTITPSGCLPSTLCYPVLPASRTVTIGNVDPPDQNFVIDELLL